MARLVAAGLLLSLLAVPVASAGLGELLPTLVPGEREAVEKVQEARQLAERAAGEATGDAQNSLAPQPFVVAGDGLAPDLAAFFAVTLGLAAAAALGLVGGARFVTPAEVLENAVRQRMYAHLRERTGATLKQLTDDLGLTTTNAIWHLRKLEDAGLIHSRRFNGFKVFYPAEGGVRARQLSLSMTALQNDNAQEVFEYVLAHPGTHQREIARALAVNHGTVRWHLKKLRGADLLVEERRGKTSTYQATEIGRQAFSQVRRQEVPVAVQAPVPTGVSP